MRKNLLSVNTLKEDAGIKIDSVDVSLVYYFFHLSPAQVKHQHSPNSNDSIFRNTVTGDNTILQLYSYCT